MRLVKPKKNLGQHFLTDLHIASSIADTVDACPYIPVLEIGPGMGVLTQFLVKKNRDIKAVEIDAESVKFLNDNFPELRAGIIGADFLRMDLNTVFVKMLENKDLIPCCTGMIQREVAQRIASAPGNKAYGILSVFIQAWYNVEYLFTVDENVFNPPPKVKSAVIRMTRNNITSLGCNEVLFRRVVKAVFNQRRKMLRVSLRQLLSTVPNTDDFFMKNEIMTMRPEQLSVAQFVDLTNLVEKQISKEK
jgi:16S rRNA (adenine1518-N6/adenine1519-N6)-dimethyltransferase